MPTNELEEVINQLFPDSRKIRVDPEKRRVSFTIQMSGPGFGLWGTITLNAKKAAEMTRAFGEEWEIRAESSATHLGASILSVTISNVVFPPK